VSRDIAALAWDKLLVSVASGALGAITRLDHGQLDQIREIGGTAFAAVGETMTAARASGMTLCTARVIASSGPSMRWSATVCSTWRKPPRDSREAIGSCQLR